MRAVSLSAAGWLALAGAIWLASCLIALCAGRYPLDLSTLTGYVWHLAGGRSDLTGAQLQTLHALIYESRLPRLLGASMMGAALALAGATYQSAFRNPLVSPGLLGVLSGAGFGAALAIVLGLPAMAIQGTAFAGGLLASAVGVGIAHRLGGGSPMTLIFGGLISNALFTALLSILKFVADPDQQLSDIVFWLLGSLDRLSMPGLLPLALVLVPGGLLLLAMARLLDLLTLGDDEANALGIPAVRLRYLVIATATLIAAMTVAAAGIIGWLGLIVPHVTRLLVGPQHRRMMPVAALLGASFLVLADTLSRSLSSTEIPVGIMTELAGALSLLAVLHIIRRYLW